MRTKTSSLYLQWSEVHFFGLLFGPFDPVPLGFPVYLIYHTSTFVLTHSRCFSSLISHKFSPGNTYHENFEAWIYLGFSGWLAIGYWFCFDRIFSFDKHTQNSKSLHTHTPPRKIKIKLWDFFIFIHSFNTVRVLLILVLGVWLCGC